MNALKAPIMLQFSFSSWGAIPVALSERVPELQSPQQRTASSSVPTRELFVVEQLEDREARKTLANGLCIIQAQHKTALLPFIRQLEEEGYVLVGARIESRIKADGFGRYWMVRFSFLHDPIPSSSEASVEMRAIAMSALRQMCVEALWRVRAFRNPSSGRPDYFFSVNMEARVPLYRPDGQSVLERERDGQGNKIDDEPVPISHLGTLRLSQDDGGPFIHP
jgi:hypothetical protein